jgi:hypothetical protein
MKLSKITGNQDLVRDMETNSIHNTNREEYSKYLEASRLKLREKEKIENIERDLTTITTEINEVKNLLQKLLETRSLS